MRNFCWSGIRGSTGRLSFPRVEVGERHQRKTVDDPGQESGREQTADGNIGDDSDDYEVDRGWDELRSATRGRDQRGRERFGILPSLHLWQCHRADRCGIRARRPAYSREEHGGQNRHHPHRTADLPDKEHRHGDDASRNAPLAHDRAREDEERDGEEGE